MYFHHVRVSGPMASVSRSRIPNERGFGLVEVMIVAAIVSIIALGMGTLVSDMFRAQAKSTQKGSLNSVRAEMINAINNATSWDATVAHADNNTNMACLRAGASTECTEATAYGFNLYASASSLIYPSLTATAGFSPSGTPCNTFSTTSPDPQCPFRWTLTWTGDCLGGAATCFTPDITVNGTFQYAPGDGQQALGGGFNANAYNFSIRRGSAAIRNDAVIIAHVETDNSGETGVCNTGGVARSFSRVVSDPGNNLVNKTAAGDRTSATPGGAAAVVQVFTLRPGTYNCRVNAPAFKNGGNRIRLERTAGAAFTPVESAVALAPHASGGSANVTLEATISVNSDVSLRVFHICTETPSTAPSGATDDNWSLGVPVPPPGGYGNGVTYTTVTCQRTS